MLLVCADLLQAALLGEIGDVLGGHAPCSVSGTGACRVACKEVVFILGRLLGISHFIMMCPHQVHRKRLLLEPIAHVRIIIHPSRCPFHTFSIYRLERGHRLNPLLTCQLGLGVRIDSTSEGIIIDQIFVTSADLVVVRGN